MVGISYFFTRLKDLFCTSGVREKFYVITLTSVGILWEGGLSWKIASPIASIAKLLTPVFTKKSDTQLQNSLAYAMETLADESRENPE